MMTITITVKLGTNDFSNNETWDWTMSHSEIPPFIDMDIPSDCAMAAVRIAQACGMTVISATVNGKNQDGIVNETFMLR